LSRLGAGDDSLRVLEGDDIECSDGALLSDGLRKQVKT
jgi:hypothetical protein